MQQCPDSFLIGVAWQNQATAKVSQKPFAICEISAVLGATLFMLAECLDKLIN